MKPLPKTKKEVGIDLGITALATCSDGKQYKNIRAHRTLQARLRVLNKDLHRKKRGSNNRGELPTTLKGRGFLSNQ